MKEKIAKKLSAWWQHLVAMVQGNSDDAADQKPPYTHCRNCGAELFGTYCHRCGQYATLTNMKMSEFVKEYIKNMFPIERQIIPTMVNMFFRPGHLIKEYCAGRRVPYLHPLKLNLFLLLVLITLFSIFGTDTKVQNSLSDNIDKNILQVETMFMDVEENLPYMERVMKSPRDTINLIIPLLSTQNRKQMIVVVDTLGLDAAAHSYDTLRCVVPTILIEDNILIRNEDDGEEDTKEEFYRTSVENELTNHSFSSDKVYELWQKLTTGLFNHFPLLVLLTTPLLVFPMRVVLRRRKRPSSHHYIFALFYIAFMEIIFLLAYIIYMATKEFAFIINTSLLASLVLYLMVALKQAYDIKSWSLAAIASLIINTMYTLLCSAAIIFAALCVLIYIVIENL